MEPPEVDVVIPLFNKSKYVEQAVRSALDQSLPPSRVIVADDGSTDGSSDIVEMMVASDPRILLLRNERGSGSGEGRTRHRGIAASTAPFIAFLDADDWWEPAKLERQMPLFADERVGLVNCACNFVTPEGRFLFVRQVDPLPPPDKLYEAVRLETYAVIGSASAAVVRRSMWDRTTGFSDAKFAADWRAWCSCAEQGYFASVPEALTNYRVGVSGASTRADTFVRWLKRYDEWMEDEAFMEKVLRRARTLAIAPQIEALRFGANRELLERIRKEGGITGQRLFDSSAAYWLNLARLPMRLKEVGASRLRGMRARG
jgi:glycosyltransferase involved in cell wall biosynthesis